MKADITNNIEMRNFPILLILIYLQSLLVASSMPSIFDPVFEFSNGEYWGAYYFNDNLGIKIPHGQG